MAKRNRDQQKDPIYYHFILARRDLASKIDGSFFENSTIKPMYELARNYTLKYGTAPSKEDFMSMVALSDISEEERKMLFSESRIDVVYSRVDEVCRYGEDALADEIKTYCQWLSLGETLASGISEYKLNEEIVTPDNVQEAIGRVYSKLSKTNVVTFADDNLGCGFWDISSHEAVHIEHWTTGHSYIDLCLKGGFYAGSLHVFMGAPKVGKSMWLCDLASKSVVNGIDTAYVSLELNEATVLSRVTPNILGINQLEYEHLLEYDKDKLSQLMSDKSKTFKNGRGVLHVISLPANSATADNIADLLKKIQERYTKELNREFRFKNVIVDYLAIAKSSLRDQSNLYLNGKRVAEEFRSIGVINNWCIISATQANKTQYGSSDIDETQVAESSGLNATVDSMFGIIKDPMMGAAGLYRLKCIYDRIAPFQGKEKSFLFNSDTFSLYETSSDIISDSESTVYLAAMQMESSVHSTKKCKMNLSRMPQKQLSVSDAKVVETKPVVQYREPIPKEPVKNEQVVIQEDPNVDITPHENVISVYTDSNQPEVVVEDVIDASAFQSLSIGNTVARLNNRYEAIKKLKYL